MQKINDRLLIYKSHGIDVATFNKLFGRVLGKMRGTDDFDLTRTSQNVGLDRAFLYAVEKGEKGVSLFTLFRLASNSKLSASEIVGLLEKELSSEIEVQP